MRRRSTRSATAPPSSMKVSSGASEANGAQAEVERIAKADVDEPGQRDVLRPGADAARNAPVQRRRKLRKASAARKAAARCRRARNGIGDGDAGSVFVTTLGTRVPFPCPGCEAAMPRSPDRWAFRCPACRRRHPDPRRGRLRREEARCTKSRSRAGRRRAGGSRCRGTTTKSRAPARLARVVDGADPGPRGGVLYAIARWGWLALARAAGGGRPASSGRRRWPWPYLRAFCAFSLRLRDGGSPARVRSFGLLGSQF